MEKDFLIVVDMQNDFVTGTLGSQFAKDIVQNVKNKVDTALKDGKTVIFTRDTHDDYYDTTIEGKNLPVKHCVKYSDGWEIIPELSEESEKCKIFDKYTFGSRELARYLYDRDIYYFSKHCKSINIEIIGLCTDICVIANAITIKTFIPNANISVDSKCCAGVTKESHDNALNAMKQCHIVIS